MSIAIGAVVLVAAGWLVWRNRHDISEVLARVGPGPFVVSGVLAVLGTILIGQLWLALVRGSGVSVGQLPAAEVFFVSQLGKYVPGSLWPVVVQMEWGRRVGIGRRTMLVANVLLIVVVTVTGLMVGGVLLALARPSALGEYGWLLFFLLPLSACLHPRVVPTLVDRGLRLLGRTAPGLRISGRGMVTATGWGLATWVVLGLHVLVLTRALGAHGPTAVAVATGGIALGWAAGLIAIPAPAGAGVRDAVLVAALSSRLSLTAALTVALGSRVLLILADVLLAGAGYLGGRWGRLGRSGSSAETQE